MKRYLLLAGFCFSMVNAMISDVSTKGNKALPYKIVKTIPTKNPESLFNLTKKGILEHLKTKKLQYKDLANIDEYYRTMITDEIRCSIIKKSHNLKNKKYPACIIFPECHNILFIDLSDKWKRILVCDSYEDYNNTVKIFDFCIKLLKDIKINDASIRACAFSPNGNYVLTATQNGNIGIYNHEGERLWNFQVPISGFCNVLTNAEFAPDSNSLYIHTCEPKNRIYDLRGLELENLTGHWTIFSFSPNPNFLITGKKQVQYENGALSNRNGKEIIPYDKIKFTSDGKYALVCKDNKIALFNLNKNFEIPINKIQKLPTLIFLLIALEMLLIEESKSQENKRSCLIA